MTFGYVVRELLYCIPHSFWDTRQRPQRSVSSSQPSPPPPSRILRVLCPLLACCLLLLWPFAGLQSLTLNKSYTKVAVQCTAPQVAKVAQFFLASSGGSGIPYVLRQAQGSGICNGIRIFFNRCMVLASVCSPPGVFFVSAPSVIRYGIMDAGTCICNGTRMVFIGRFCHQC